MKQIELHGKNGEGLFALVSDEDYERVSKFEWFVKRDVVSPSYITVRRSMGTGKNYKEIYLHRFIIGDKPGMLVDHINRNTLDNRRENLRHVTYSESNFNRSMSDSSTTGLRGATRKGNSWQAQASKKYLGTFKTQEEAHQAFLNYLEVVA